MAYADSIALIDKQAPKATARGQASPRVPSTQAKARK